MLKKIGFALALVAVTVPNVTYAGDKYVVHPIRVADESIRFYKGTPTIDIDGNGGSVQISPLRMDHGSFSFSVAVLNKKDADADFDITNVTAEFLGSDVAVFSKEELEKKAQNRAMWATLAVALAGGISSVAAANQRDYYRSTLVTPHGTYRGFYSAPSVAGQVQATALAAGTAYSVDNIRRNLDATKEALGDNIIQRTTIAPGESYAGQVIFQKIKLKKVPERFVVVVKWNGEEYHAGFILGKSGMKAPEIAPAPACPSLAPASDTPAPAPSEGEKEPKESSTAR